MTFEDFWFKREEEVKKENIYFSEEGFRFEIATGFLKFEVRVER